MAADPITWPLAFTIVGGITVAVVGLAGYLNQAFKRETPWVEPIAKLNDILIKLETTVSQLSNKMDDASEDLTEHEARNTTDFDRIHKRLEKVTDLMIDMIRDDSSNHDSDKTEKE